MQGVYINGEMDGIQFQRIQLTKSAIIAFLKVNGEIDISIDGLK
jgi:hypothetical protein